MNASRFNKHAEEFTASANYLAATAASNIPHARAALTASSPPMGAPSNESAAEMCLRDLSERIEDLMLIHDALLESIGMSPRYWSFFQSLKLTPDGWNQLRHVLEEHVDDSGPT